jgi:hypothetical protein
MCDKEGMEATPRMMGLVARHNKIPALCILYGLYPPQSVPNSLEIEKYTAASSTRV